MIRFLKSLAVFKTSLKFFSILSKYDVLNPFTKFLTSYSAKLNIFINKAQKVKSVEELAKNWQKLMPADARELFQIKSIDGNTAITEIHLHCPLRGTGLVNSCYKLMNYDRTLMKKVGGQLVVLESQANSGNNYCKIAIRPEGEDISDLKPAHLVNRN